MSGLDIRPAGDRALLLIPAPGTLAGLVDELRRHPVEGVRDQVPAAETVLVTLIRGRGWRRSRRGCGNWPRRLRRARARPPPIRSGCSSRSATTEPIWRETAALLGISEEELISRHTGSAWRCAFLGFAPGFGYLESADSICRCRAGRALHRRARRVGRPGRGYSAVYPRSTPGGWRIIGTTEVRMWDPRRPEPALLRPGARVRFVREGT